MSDPFNAYQAWLGIPPEECDGGRPHHYQLLGLRVFEKNPHAIDAAARRMIATLTAFATGPHQSLAEQLILEAAAAAACLRDPAQKAQYDRALASGEPLPAATDQPQANVPVPVVFADGSPGAAAVDYVQSLVQAGIAVQDEYALQRAVEPASPLQPSVAAVTHPSPTMRARGPNLNLPTIMTLLGGVVGLLAGYFIVYYLLGDDLLRLLPPREALLRLRE